MPASLSRKVAARGRFDTGARAMVWYGGGGLVDDIFCIRESGVGIGRELMDGEVR